MKNRLTLYQHLLSRTSKSDFQKTIIGVIQCSTGLDIERNFEHNKVNVEHCAQRGAQMVCLPENFNYMGRSYEDDIAAAEPLSGPSIKRYRQLALDNRVWLSLGGFQERIEGSTKRYNTHLLINEEGNIVKEYRKLHLFDIDMTHSGGVTVSENRFIVPG